MLERHIRGYTVIAHEYNANDRLYWILGARRIGPASYEYIVAGMVNFDNDDFWVTNGYYPTSLALAFERYSQNSAI